MKSKLELNVIVSSCAVAALSFLGGILNGTIGTGSGIFFMLCAVIMRKYAGADCDMYTLSLMCVTPISLLSLCLYPAGTIDPDFFVPLMLPSIAGGFLGAYVKRRVSTAALSTAFAAITIYSGISMILKAV